MLTPFEYILPLVSVLVGLAIADLALSVHRLLRARRRVRWDVLPLATALLAALALLEVWWVLYRAQEAAFFTTIGGFLALAAQLILLFLLNAAALPDELPEEGIDLRAFYEQEGPYFWSLYAAYIVFVLGVRVAGLYQRGAVTSEDVGGLVPNLVLLVAFIVLARVRRRSVHAVAVVLLLGLLLTAWSGLTLSPL